jgi:hypothetical protein
MSFWDTLKDVILKPVDIAKSTFKTTTSAIGTAPIGAAQGFAAFQAGRTGAPDTITSRVGQQKLVDISTPANAALQQLATPYRELVAEPLVAADFGGIRAGAREFVEGLPGDFGIEESEIAQYVSPGQSLVRNIGLRLPGEQAVDKIDFTNPTQVQDFFSKGAPKFWSGTADFGFTIGLDPFLTAGKGAQVARTNILLRPIKNEKDVLNIRAEVDAAVLEKRSPFKPLIDKIMSDEIASEADVLTLGLFSHATKQIDLAKSLIDAKAVGREAVGDVLKAGFGDVKAIQKITTEFNSARKAFLEAEQIPSWIKADLEKPIIGGEFNIPSLAEGQRLLREANEQLQKTGMVDERLLRIIKGDFEAGTEFDGIFGTIRNRTAARYEFLERARVKNAGRASDSYWGVTEYKSPNGVTTKILSWLDRGALQKEVPSGFIVTNERGSQTAYRELIANVRFIEKKTGQSVGWSKNKISQWAQLTTKKARNDFLEEFEDEAAYLIIKNKVPGTEKMSSDQLEFLKMLAKELSSNYRRAKYRELAKVLENGYHVLDDTGTPMYVEGLEKFVKTFGETTDSYKTQVLKKLEGTPLLESDVPAIIQLMDFNTFETVVLENPDSFAKLVDLIKKSGLDEKGLRNQVRELSSRKVLQRRGDKGAKTQAQIALDYAKIIGDTYTNLIWKPITLLRLGYTQRNIAEGSLRIPVAVAALSEELGYSKWAMTKDLLPIHQATKATVNNILEYSRVRGARKAMSTQQKELVSDIQKYDDLIRQNNGLLTDLVREGNGYVKELKTIRGSRLQDVENLFKIAITKFPKAKQKEYDNLIQKFFDENITTDELEKAIDLFTIKLQNEKDVAEFGKFFTFLNKALQNNLDEVDTLLQNGAQAKAAAKAKNIARYPITPIEIDLLDRLRQVYSSILSQNQTIYKLQMHRAGSLDYFEELALGATPSYIRLGEDVFEVSKGVFVDDAFTGKLGEFARSNSSAGRTFRTVVEGNSRDTLINIAGRKSSSITIEPDSPEWADAFVRYFNTKLHNDELAVRVAQGESDAKIYTWLKSPDGAKYRKNAETGIKEWARGDLRVFVQAVRLMTERTLAVVPEVDLRKALIQGDLTPEKALRIPRDLRVSVKGFEVYPNKFSSVSAIYQKGIELFFKYLGSMPEDMLLRHPLYRAVYRNEMRSLGNLIETQGKEMTDELWQSIGRQAHVRANKMVTETLYTVERFTEPATFFRLASPFWMAQQNSSKFWLGESIKNPRIPYLGLMGWNSVNESLTVRDADEYNRRAGGNTLPFNSGEQIWITLPKGVAKAMGVEDMRILKLSKDSANLVLQGAIPLFPGLGSPIQIPATAIAKRLVGTSFDPDKELNRFGPSVANTVREAIFGPQIKGAEGLLPSNAWIQNAKDYFFYEQSPRYWQRVNLIAEKKALELNDAGEAIDEKGYLKIYEEASRQARNTFLWGILFGAASPVSTQLGSEYELFKSELRLYTRPVENGGYGFEEGIIKFEEHYGSSATVYARSSLSYNPAGLISNNATIKNILDNKSLFDEVFSKDEAIAGAFANTGSIDDFSPLAYQKLFEIKVAGKPLRSKREDVAEAEERRLINAGWSEYLKVSAYYDSLMMAKSIKPGTKASEPYSKALQESAIAIGKDYPVWYSNREQELNLSKKPRVEAINTVLNDDKFNNSSQAKTPLWQGLREWANVRQEYSDMLQAEGRQQASDSYTAAIQESARLISLDYPEFGPFFERYLKQDRLDRVQVRLR